MSLNEAQIERVRTLWCEEHRTAAEIAEVFGVTRCAILGLTNRRGFVKPKVARPKPPPRKPRSAPVIAAERQSCEASPIATADVDFEDEEAALDDELLVKTALPLSEVFSCQPVAFDEFTLTDLKPEQCRWPTDRVEDQHLFCGRNAQGAGWMRGGAPYCVEHMAKASAGRVTPRMLKKDFGL